MVVHYRVLVSESVERTTMGNRLVVLLVPTTLLSIMVKLSMERDPSILLERARRRVGTIFRKSTTHPVKTHMSLRLPSKSPLWLGSSPFDGYVGDPGNILFDTISIF